MADLKTLKIRIGSIKKTQKITKAMKMVAASKLRKAREAAELSREYSATLQNIISSQNSGAAPATGRSLVYGVNDAKNLLLIVNTTDRGLCGGLNSNIVKSTVDAVKKYEQEGYAVKIWCIGKKGYAQLKNLCKENIANSQEGYAGKKIEYKDAKDLADEVITLFLKGEFDICKVIYPFFKSAINQDAKIQTLIPCEADEAEVQADDEQVEFEYEPGREELLEEIAPKNIAIQLFQSLLETYASEQGARMTAMDNAVNNCADMVKKLELKYNRSRQAKITTELIEIIAASESV